MRLIVMFYGLCCLLLSGCVPPPSGIGEQPADNNQAYMERAEAEDSAGLQTVTEDGRRIPQGVPLGVPGVHPSQGGATMGQLSPEKQQARQRELQKQKAAMTAELESCKRETQGLLKQMPQLPGGVNVEKLCICAIEKNRSMGNRDMNHMDVNELSNSLIDCMNERRGTSVNASGERDVNVVDILNKLLGRHDDPEPSPKVEEEKSQQQPQRKANRNYKYDPKTKTWSN